MKKKTNRKVQLRLAPYTKTSWVLEYRIFPDELNLLKRFFCNSWKQVPLYALGFISPDNLNKGWIPLLISISSDLEYWKSKIFDEDTLNHHIQIMKLKHENELKTINIEPKGYVY